MSTFIDKRRYRNAIRCELFGPFSINKHVIRFDEGEVDSELSFRTLYFWRLSICSIFSSFQKSTPSRIINVASAAHQRGQINTIDLNSEKHYDPGDAYSQSKLANILFTRNLARRLTGTGVTVNAVDPGLVDTQLMRHMSVFKSISG